MTRTRLDPITRALQDVRDTFATDDRGTLPDYIPELATVDPGLFGISLASLSGKVYSVGDADVPFTIQSVSKPFVYAMALIDHGLEAVLERVGAEPSGEAFNAASLDPVSGRPVNPMINAGAIVTTSLVEAPDGTARFDRIRRCLSLFAGHALEIDERVYRSELETGDNNRALGYLMRNAGSLTGDVDETLDAYFRQCSLLVTTRDLAVMAATLANGGVNPVSGVRAVPAPVASHVLTLMGTCGMYDSSGEWLLRVGMPAKSGVSGALIATKLAQFGMGLFSPLLDEQGNSVRAVETCRNLAERFGLHLLNDPGVPPPAIWLESSGAEHRSTMVRSVREEHVLREHGEAIRIWGLQGEIGFAAAEHVLQSITASTESARGGEWLILDLDRVGRMHRSAQALLEALVGDLRGVGITVVVVDALGRGLMPGTVEFPRFDAAIESCEDSLLKVRM